MITPCSRRLVGFRVIVLLLGVLSTAAAQTNPAAPTPNDEARFLAGLPVRDTPLESLSHSQAWATHATEFDQAWAQLDKHQFQGIQAWAPAALGHWYTDTTPVLYLFSGPDFLYARAFFPQASTYILCGIEPIGPLPQVEQLLPETLGPALDSVRQSLDAILNFSFFITKKMRVDLQDSRLTGTLPLLYIFLARSGCIIRDVTFTGLDSHGQFTAARTLAPAVKITFTSPGAKTDQTLYYFSTDLSDEVVGHSGLFDWCATLGPSRSFLKAASYLMHTGDFNTTRQFLLAHSAAILQDDSGIPSRYFDLHQWDLRMLGAYHLPIDSFKQYPQQQLIDLTAVQKPAPLPFSVGYRWHPGESSLLFAVHAATPPPR